MCICFSCCWRLDPEEFIIGRANLFLKHSCVTVIFVVYADESNLISLACNPHSDFWTPWPASIQCKRTNQSAWTLEWTSLVRLGIEWCVCAPLGFVTLRVGWSAYCKWQFQRCSNSFNLGPKCLTPLGVMVSPWNRTVMLSVWEWAQNLVLTVSP